MRTWFNTTCSNGGISNKYNEQELVKSKKMLDDAISMIGNGFYHLPMKRRNEIKACLNPRYKNCFS